MNASIPPAARRPADDNSHVFDTMERSLRLQYISQMLRELRNQARSLDEDTLGYLIEMAMLESVQVDEIEKFQRDLASGESGSQG